MATPHHTTVDDEVHVFEPHSTSDVPALKPYLRELWERRRFMMAMARADVQGKRSNTFAGQFWAVLDPALQALMYFLLIGILREGERGQGANLALLVGSLFLFNQTRIALDEGARSISGGGRIMLNTRFPAALLPIAAIYRGWLQLLPSIPVYIALHLFVGAPVGQGIVMLPFLFAIHTLMNLGIALGMATLTVYVQDITNLLGYVSRLLLFTTPVLYPVSFLEGTPAGTVLRFNPLYPVFAAYQSVLMGDIPSFGMVSAAIAWAVGIFVVGAYFFVTREGSFAVRL